MTPEEFVKESLIYLPLVDNDLGEVVYSSADTLKKGKFYYLGLNPGGRGFITIQNHLKRFPTRKSNSFFDEVWNNESQKYDKGKSPLQLRVQYLFEELLKVNLRDVFATNLIFKTTPNADNLNFGLAGLCWNVHLLALSVVQPEVIITCGNEQGKSAFFFISDLYSDGYFKKYDLTKTLCIKVSNIMIQNRSTLLIGIPHLSRFEIRNNHSFQQMILQILAGK